MLKIKIVILLTFFNLNLIAQNNLNIAIQNKYGCGNIGPGCTKNICTDNVLCKIYSNQNMCVLQSQIPQELKNLSYVIYPIQFNSYNTARFNFNKRFNIFPHAIIKPETAAQVAYIISVMRKLKLDFSVRSGGHCFGPGSLAPGYVIDLSNFNSIIPNIEKKEVFIGAGCNLGSVIQSLGNINFAIPTGTCPSVGVTGLALGGGIGFLARQFGLTSDSIKSIIMVDEHSDIIEVTATNKYKDLFWALCGAGGGSFGIVIGFTFKMYHIPKATFVNLKFDWNSSQVIALFQTWQSWVKSLPTDIASEFGFSYKPEKTILSINSFRPNGKPFTQWQNVFNQFNPKITVTKGTYLDCAKKSSSVLTQPFAKAKSKFLFSKVPDAGIQVIIDQFNFLQQNKFNFHMFVTFGIGGGKLAQGHSAYFARNALYYNFQFVYWDFETENAIALKSIDDFYNNFEPFTSPYSYANLVDYQLGNTFLNAYYGTHVNRLIRIKNKYDPENLFKWKQSIPLKI